jgi:hypothetical protein
MWAKRCSQVRLVMRSTKGEGLLKNPLTSAVKSTDLRTIQQETVQPPSYEKKWRKVNVWSVKGPFLVVTFLLGALSAALHWGTAPIAAAVAMTVPMIGFRDFWDEARFWVTIVALGAAQVPLVVIVRPLIEQYRFAAMFTFGILDCVFVVQVISRVCSQPRQKKAND